MAGFMENPEISSRPTLAREKRAREASREDGEMTHLQINQPERESAAKNTAGGNVLLASNTTEEVSVR